MICSKIPLGQHACIRHYQLYAHSWKKTSYECRNLTTAAATLSALDVRTEQVAYALANAGLLTYPPIATDQGIVNVIDVSTVKSDNTSKLKLTEQMRAIVSTLIKSSVEPSTANTVQLVRKWEISESQELPEQMELNFQLASCLTFALHSGLSKESFVPIQNSYPTSHLVFVRVNLGDASHQNCAAIHIEVQARYDAPNKEFTVMIKGNPSTVTFIPSKLTQNSLKEPISVYTLPSMKEAWVTELQYGNQLEEKALLQKYWENRHGITLPNSFSLCTVKYEIESKLKYTYPSCCVASAPVIFRSTNEGHRREVLSLLLNIVQSLPNNWSLSTKSPLLHQVKILTPEEERTWLGDKTEMERETFNSASNVKFSH